MSDHAEGIDPLRDHRGADQAKISEFVADVIRGHDHEATVVDIKGSKAPKPDDYDAVIVGASIHMGKHENYVLDFVRENRDALERLPSAFFSVSMAAHDDIEEAEGYIEEFVRQDGLASGQGWPLRRCIALHALRIH